MVKSKLHRLKENTRESVSAVNKALEKTNTRELVSAVKKSLEIRLKEQEARLKKLESVTSKKKAINAIGKKLGLKKESSKDEIYAAFLRKIMNDIREGKFPRKELPERALNHFGFQLTAVGDLYEKRNRGAREKRVLVERNFAVKKFEEAIRNYSERIYKIVTRKTLVRTALKKIRRRKKVN